MPTAVVGAVGGGHRALDEHGDGGCGRGARVAPFDGGERTVEAVHANDGGVVGRLLAAAGVPRGPGFVHGTQREGIAPGLGDLQEAALGAGWGEEGQFHRLACVEVEHGRVLHEAAGFVVDEVGDVERQVGGGGEGHVLEDAADPRRRSDRQVVRRGQGTLVFRCKTTGQRGAAHQQHKHEGGGGPAPEHGPPWRSHFSSLFLPLACT